MKTFIISTFVSFLIALAVVLPVASARADNHMIRVADTKAPKTYNIGMYRVSNSSKINLAVAKKADQRMIIRIKDEKGVVLYQERQGKGAELYKRYFNFDQFSTGTFYFEIEVDGEVATRTVEISTTEQRLIAVE